jgi:pimeloyl-ACP methyl ester carboxylesterase
MTTFDEHRAGSGEPLVLVHGITATWRVWTPVLPELERHHDVIAPTLAGHRGGAPPAYGPGVLGLTDALERRLDELGLDRPHVAGNSLGGWIALELARRGRARSIVALSPGGGWSSSAALTRVIMLIRSGHRLALRDSAFVRSVLARPRSRRLFLSLAVEHGERISVSDAIGTMTDNAGCTVIDEFMASIRRDGPLAGPLSAPDCPIRVAWPDRDRLIPFERYGVPLLAAVPGAELVRLPGVGHVPMSDDPQLVARTILEVTAPVDSPGHICDHQTI